MLFGRFVILIFLLGFKGASTSRSLCAHSYLDVGNLCYGRERFRVSNDNCSARIPLGYLRAGLGFERCDSDLAWANLKGLTHLWKSRIYPKYMPKCLVGSTDYVCKILGNEEDIDVRNFHQKMVSVTVILGREENLRIWQRTSHAILALQIRFFYYSNVQRTFKNGRLKSTVLTRPHAMKRHKIKLPKEWGTKILYTCQLWSRIFSQRGKWGCFDWYFDIFIWSAPNLTISTQN